MPVVARHPFYDVRLVEFLLGLPNYMTRNKAVLRGAMHNVLPNPVLARTKTPAVGDLLRAKLSSKVGQSRVRSNLDAVAEVFVDQERYLAAFEKYLDGEGEESTWSSWLMVAPVALNYWVRYHWPRK